MRKLESEVARLQSTLERNEVSKQELQYQLEVEQHGHREKQKEHKEREKNMENQQKLWEGEHNSIDYCFNFKEKD